MGKTSKILAHFLIFFELTANIPGTDRHIENRKSSWSNKTPTLGAKKIDELLVHKQKS